MTGGRCSEVIYVVKVRFGTSKLWSLYMGGRYLEGVISSVLTVFVIKMTCNLLTFSLSLIDEHSVMYSGSECVTELIILMKWNDYF